MKIGQKIRAMRKQSGIKQKDFAETLGVTPTYLSLIEKGRAKPGLNLLFNVCEQFEITIGELLFEAMCLKSKNQYQKKKTILNFNKVVDVLSGSI